jgi:hypothetical protein
LRQNDLLHLEGHNSYFCFLLNSGAPPLFVPYMDFERVFKNEEPARDGQYKVQLISGPPLELYVARQGRFNVEAYVGLESLERSIDSHRLQDPLDLSHSQVQTLLASIGNLSGYDAYVPGCDYAKLDWAMIPQFALRRQLPDAFRQVHSILSEIDVVWLAKGRNRIEGLYEVEYSTPVYSGLLRLNDILLSDHSITRFTVVSNDTRRDLFARQLFRPSFRKSGLSDFVASWSIGMFLLGTSAC